MTSPAGSISLTPAVEIGGGFLRLLAATALVGGGLIVGGLPPLLAAGLALVIGVPALLRLQVWWLGPALVPLALLGGGFWALAAWSLAGAGCCLAWWLLRQQRQERRLQPLRRELGSVGREIAILQRHLAQYPPLLDACMTLADLRTFDDLARLLARAVQELLPEAWLLEVHLHTERGLTCRERRRDAARAAASDEVAAQVAYSSGEGRPCLQRRLDSVLAVLPLGQQGNSDAEDYGVLVVQWPSRGLADHLQIEIIEALAQIGGLGLDNLAILAEARALALHDELTGLYGQHEFLRRLDEQLGLARRQGTGLGVIMCDMDRLKDFNDRYGHPAGDAALRAVAAAIGSVLPPQAVACRYGGEEFAILVPAASGARTGAVAVALHQAIGQLRPQAEAPQVPLTASLGWAQVQREETAMQVLARADEACYQAKRLGRNRVIAADDESLSVVPPA